MIVKIFNYQTDKTPYQGLGLPMETILSRYTILDLSTKKQST